MSKFWPLPAISQRPLSGVQEMRPTALITHAQYAPQRVALQLPTLVQAEPDEHTPAFLEYLAGSLPSATEVIYVFGEGNLIDAGKFVAYKTNKPLIVIPTALSDDKAFTPEVNFYSADEWAQINTGAPGEIILDFDLLRAAPPHLRTSGLAEVITVVTAMMDWGYAAQRNQAGNAKFTGWATAMAASVAQQAVKSAAAIGHADDDGLTHLVALLCQTIQLDGLLGHKRASQGAEHTFAAAASGSALAAHTTFAERLGAGILLASAMHGREASGLRVALEAAGLRLGQIKPADLLEILTNLPAYAVKNGRPFGILNDTVMDAEKLASLTKSALSS
jgi:glycerol-1-phosphate dehydrogenase [NAD(P)+]